MSKRPIPRLCRGFRDIFAGDISARSEMINRIKQVYERYGFSPLETPVVEYVDVLGKFLPESDQPEGGIFSFKNDEKEWVALRYDLTASLSRVVAQYVELPRPFRRYQIGAVYRQEKPGPGRYREFYQFDFDTVGAGSMAADAEVCCVMCEVLEAAGIDRGDYIVRVNNRKVLNGVLESVGFPVTTDPSDEKAVWVDILRSIDKLDKIGLEGVKLLLTTGRRDPSGDFTAGLNLPASAVDAIEGYLGTRAATRIEVCNRLAEIVGESAIGREGVEELRQIDGQLAALGFDERRVIFDPTVIRGLGYYTGPVFEAELTFEIKDDEGRPKQFGSVMGGGRYDSLVERFTGQKVAATGASIGVDRLLAALKALGRVKATYSTAQVLVTVMSKGRIADYQLIAQELRNAGINAELFIGSGNIGKQLKYADATGVPVALIAGDDEFAAGTIQLKDLQLGREMSEQILEREQWRSERPAQLTIQRTALIEQVREMLGRYGL